MPNPHAPENGHSEALPLALTDLRLDGAGEPRVLDLDVAERLGFDRPNNIRDLINRNADELRRYGDLVEVEGVTGEFTARRGKPLGGRPGRAFLLNHDQAMIVAVLSRAPRAADVRQQLIQVYNAYRATRTAPVQSPEPSADVENLRSRVRRLEGTIARRRPSRGGPPLLPAPKHNRKRKLLPVDYEAVSRFLRDHVRRSPDSAVLSADLFDAYRSWQRVMDLGQSLSLSDFQTLCMWHWVTPPTIGVPEVRQTPRGPELLGLHLAGRRGGRA